MDSPKDVCGFPISVGDYMVQAYNKGRSAALKFTRVVSVKDGKVRVVGGEVREYPKITNGETTWTKVWRATNATTLNYPDRSMVVPHEVVPIGALHILEEKDE